MSSAEAFPVDRQPTPKGLLEKLGAALPIALTAIATAFAGLSTSEMSRAMYWRSAAAQDQAKSNDQWSLAAHKRDRAIMMQTSALQLRPAEVAPPNAPVAGDDSFGPPGPTNDAAREWILRGGPPPQTFPAIDDAAIVAVLDANREGQPEAALLRLARGINHLKLEQSLDRANAELRRIDTEWQPVLDALARRLAAVTASRDRAQQANHLEVEQRRYRIEAGLNQQLGHLYEVRVRTSTVQAERHRVRSEYFFYALLVAQAGAALGAMALARRRRSALWLMAGIVGLVSVGFGAYIYLSM